jgi:hypothetical protein
VLVLGERTLVMGAQRHARFLGDGGQFVDPERAVDAALRWRRPAPTSWTSAANRRGRRRAVDAADERRRIEPIQQLAGRIRIPLSIDTYKAGGRRPRSRRPDRE